jgi:hypothetical protein
VGIGREDQGAEAGERPEGRAQWCALILVDLDVPADAKPSDIAPALERWSQGIRFAAATSDSGVRTGDVSGVVIEAPADDIAAALHAVASQERP